MQTTDVEVEEDTQTLRVQSDCVNPNCEVHQYGQTMTHTVAAQKRVGPAVSINDPGPSHLVN